MADRLHTKTSESAILQVEPNKFASQVLSYAVDEYCKGGWSPPVHICSGRNQCRSQVASDNACQRIHNLHPHRHPGGMKTLAGPHPAIVPSHIFRMLLSLRELLHHDTSRLLNRRYACISATDMPRGIVRQLMLQEWQILRRNTHGTSDCRSHRAVYAEIWSIWLTTAY